MTISPFPSHFQTATIALSESLLEPTGVESGANPDDDTFDITNSAAGGRVNWSITNTQSWLTIDTTSGSTMVSPDSDTITVSYDITGLGADTYNDTITITDPHASNSPQTITVDLTVTSAGQWFGCDAEPATGNGSSTANYTYIFHESSPVAGNITKIEIYVSDESGGVFDFAVFTGPGGAGSYTDAHRVTGLAISNGLNQYEDGVDFDKANLPIEIGEWIGAYITSNGIWRKITSGGPGYLYDQGDQIGSGSGSSFSLSGNSTHEMQIRVWIE